MIFSGASTLNVSGKGAKPLKKLSGEDFGAGELLAGSIYPFRYNGVNFILQSESGVKINAEIANYIVDVGENISAGELVDIINGKVKKHSLRGFYCTEITTTARQYSTNRSQISADKLTDNKLLVSYTEPTENNSKYVVAVETDGNTFTFGTPVMYSSANGGSISDKYVIALSESSALLIDRQSVCVATINDKTITIGVVTNLSGYQEISGVVKLHENKVVVAFRKSSTTNGGVMVLTIDSTFRSVTFGNEHIYYTDLTYNSAITKINADRVVVVYVPNVGPPRPNIYALILDINGTSFVQRTPILLPNTSSSVNLNYFITVNEDKMLLHADLTNTLMYYAFIRVSGNTLVVDRGATYVKGEEQRYRTAIQINKETLLASGDNFQNPEQSIYKLDLINNTITLIRTENGASDAKGFINMNGYLISFGTHSENVGGSSRITLIKPLPPSGVAKTAGTAGNALEIFKL